MSEDENRIIFEVEKYIESKYADGRASTEAIRGLLDLYQQQKEKNKELTEIKQQKLSKYLHENLWICKDLSENYIHKHKIREKIEELEEEQKEYKRSKEWEIQDDIVAQINILKELLKEE